MLSTFYSFIVLVPHCRLEYQLSSLEKEVELKQQAAVKFETQLAEVQTKYEATPKQEVIDRYQ